MSSRKGGSSRAEPARFRGGLPAHAAAACAGALAVQQLPALPGAAWLVPGAVLALLAFERRRLRWLCTGLLAFAWAATAAHRHLDDWLPAGKDRGDFAVRGWVDGFPSGGAARRSFSFRVVSAADPAVPRRLRLGWYGAPQALAPGATLALTVRLERPHGHLNPAGFDYERWLLTQGYGATGYVRAGRAVSDRHWRPARAWLRFRARLAAAIEAAAPSRSAAALLTALAIGERYGFTDAEWSSLQRSGTSHLVAISGMHVGLVATLVFLAVRWLWLRLPGAAHVYDLEAAAAASAAAALGYAALAGFGVPTQRAVIMVTIALALLVSRRSVAAGNALAAAALAVLCRDPFAAASASFWMSFGAVALLLVLAGRRTLRVDRPGRWLRWRRRAAAGLSLQGAVSFGSIPLAALYFGRVSLAAPLANLVAIPAFSLVLVPLTLVGVLGLAVGLPGAAALLGFAGRLADLCWAFIHAAAALSAAALAVPPPAAWRMALAVAGIAAALPAHPLPGRRLAWVVLLPILLPRAVRPPRGAAEITMLDVGHGLAVVVATHAHRLLYDTGQRTPGFDAGREIVLPVLALAPGAGLDRVVVSHADLDHAGGARAVLAAYPGVDVLEGPDVKGLPGHVCARGQRWHWDGVAFEILHPPAGFPPLGNDSSCVLKITTAAGAVLLDGDIEARAERMLARTGEAAAAVVAVPHHGSATSSTRGFVAATHAKFALVSAAFPSRWNFPRPGVAARWRAEGARLRVTGRAGALTVELGAAGIDVFGERERRKRYWRTFSESSPGTPQQRAL